MKIDRFGLVADGGDLYVRDRLNGERVLTVARGYANLVCLETPDTIQGFTALVQWMNGLTAEELDGEGLPVEPR
ncbi:MAG: hypothetical protein BWZ02_03134 [Lentisphaerae bacterium ADurb.BinA184]|nr:MAG: hypothetical protein BWZ02_03134 [Lentisphaerae bacterium ADurb.BinA184]